MDCGGLDTRWWNLSAGVLAMTVAGCGPSIFLDDTGDTEADTGGESGPVVDEGVLPGTGGPIPCDTAQQCPDGLICLDGTCRADNDDYSDQSDQSDYSDNVDSVDYSDYSDYVDEYKDYSDYLDVNYCYEYGPFGQCCDYEPCPEYCYNNDDCFVGQLCEPGQYVNPTCNYVPFLAECETGPALIPMDIEGLPDEVISLSFLQADDDPADELLVGFGSGGAAIIDSATAMLTDLPLAKGTLITDGTSGDFDGDLDVDLVLAADGGITYFVAGDGAGGWLTPVELGAFGNISSIEALHFDGDMQLDIAFIHDGGLASVALGDGTGAFPSGVVFALGDGATVVSMAVTKLSTGAEDDLAVSTLQTDAYFLGSETQPKVLFPDVAGLLEPPHVQRTFHSQDFDLDGFDEVVGTQVLQNWTLVETLRPQGEARHALFAPGRSVGLTDLDGDSVPDLVLADPSLIVLRGVATEEPSVFDCAFLLDVSVDAPFASVGDFDGNGLGDIALSDGAELTIHQSQ